MYTNWEENEPTRVYAGVQEDCVVMNQNAAGRWNDIACTHVLRYMCRRDQTLPYANAQTPCADGTYAP